MRLRECFCRLLGENLLGSFAGPGARSTLCVEKNVQEEKEPVKTEELVEGDKEFADVYPDAKADDCSGDVGLSRESEKFTVERVVVDGENKDEDNVVG